MKLFKLIALVCLVVSPALATEYFVSPAGLPTGNGSIGNPWDLDTALGSYNAAGVVTPVPSTIHPGDTIWIRAGKYVPKSDNGYFAHLTGTASAPITVRNYQGERATLQASTNAFVLTAEGGYVTYWGLEITTSGAPRATNQPGGASPLAYGFRANAPGVQLINSVVHDTAQGISSYNSAPNAVFYGNLSYYNGWQGSDRPHGHGVYTQNVTGVKNIESNFIFDNFDMGIQAYGSGGAQITGITIAKNTVMNSGSIGDTQFKYNLILGGGSLNTGNTVTGNHFFFTPSVDYGYTNFGQYTPSSNNSFTNNDLVGGFSALTSEGAKLITVTGNKVYTRPTANAEVRFAQTPGDTKAGSVWNNNTYYGNNVFVDAQYVQDSSGNFTEVNGSFNSFASWKSSTGFDANSTWTASAPTGKWIYVEPNKFETQRANITIYNWDLSTSVDVDLSGVFATGDHFVIQDAQNFYGPAIVSGTYSGAPVSIPMHGLVKASPVGRSTPEHTAPLLGTFVALVPGAGASIPQPPLPPAPPAPLPQGSVLTAGQRVIVANQGATLNVRPNPDTQLLPIGGEQHNALGTVLTGSTTPAGQPWTFDKVAFDDGLTGWVVQDYLRVSSQPIPGPVPTAHSATLTWTASASSSVSGYNVYRSSVAGGPYVNIAPNIPPTTTYVDSSVAANATYFYTVTALSLGGESVRSNEASGTVPPDVVIPIPPVPLPPAAPSAPTGLGVIFK